MAYQSSKFALFLFALFVCAIFFVSSVCAATFTITNNCPGAIWPCLVNSGNPSWLDASGFGLQKDESRTINVPSGWIGRLWGRTNCTKNESGIITCQTGDCGFRTLECSGCSGATVPATLAEFSLNRSSGLDLYDVSLADGYNLPILVVPQGGSGRNCSTTGCVVDLNAACPSELKVVASADGSELACRSACVAFGEPQYCCSGAYNGPDTCKPSNYSKFFKRACPRAYSYAYDDDRTSLFTCAPADYAITFCPSMPTSKKTTDLPLFLSTYLDSEIASKSTRGPSSVQVVGSLITMFTAVWPLLQLLSALLSGR